jgi:type II secretory pathway pseudopilin PulG
MSGWKTSADRCLIGNHHRSKVIYMWAVRPCARLAFTLVELLMVLLILMFLFGLVSSLLGKSTIHGNEVKAAADQLAAVLNHTRQLAMEHRSVYGVSFNIQNAPGSSGAVLNNRSGGHWYRIIGPHDPSWLGGWSGVGGYNLPFLFDRQYWSHAPYPSDGTGDVELGGWLNTIQHDFIGEKYVLPKGQARFLALLDEDNGNYYSPGSHFAPTYPRPWFGDFLKIKGQANPRLYCWGGYDSGFTAIRSGSEGFLSPQNINYSGFYYQGNDPPVIGCTNPVTRNIINDPAGTSATASMNFSLLTKGDPRPLVNGDWLDCVILFNPDGTATMADWMGMRHQYGFTGHASIYDGLNFFNDNWNFNLTNLGPGDMCNYYHDGSPYNTRYENSSYADVTGTYYFTIAGDATDDTVNFPNAQVALASMLPIYRVGVSKLGEVTVVKVRTSLPPGKILDPKWAAPIWSTSPIGYMGFWNNLALSQAGAQLRPTEDIVSTQMMTSQQWWFDQ